MFLPDLNLPDLPLTAYRDKFLAGLRQGRLLLEAEPGAGKSTLAPLWALAEAPLTQAVWVVQPRVLAAQALAQRLASLLGERCGKTVGYQIPYDNCSGNETRLLLMTPGILLQHLLQNPALDGVAVVMLDEIHERGVNQDLAWAWLQEAQILREDLQLVLMSATPDPAVQQQVPERLFAAGRCFPVTTVYQPPRQNERQWPEKLPDQILRTLATTNDWQLETVLIFLPGWRDIEDCAQALHNKNPQQKILRLHSRVAASEQARALDPAEGPRIILATNIAETSLTIADVTWVIDSGLVRRAEFEQRTGISRLKTARISQASADQRRGRAGRVQCGNCVRLWSQDQPSAAADLPEIRTCDYLPLALRIAHWGTAIDDLNWLERPNTLAMQEAQQQLRWWGLLDRSNHITVAGQQVSQLGTHPRVAVLLQTSAEAGLIANSVVLLALALHFDLEFTDDLNEWLEVAAGELHRQKSWNTQRRRWLAALGLSEHTNLPLPVKNLARVFNDRIGFRQESGRYRLNSGISVEAGGLDSEWAIFFQLQPKPKGHRGLGLAFELTLAEQRQLSQCTTQLIFKNDCWQRLAVWRMGGAIIAEERAPLISDEIPAAVISHLREQIAQHGFSSLQWPVAAASLLARARLLVNAGLLQSVDDTALDLSDEGLAGSLDQWLRPFIQGQVRIESLPLLKALEFYLGYENCRLISRLLPEAIVLPSGREVKLTFSAEGVPEISAKLQEFFGCENLQLADGKIPLRIHLLSPNGSSLAITTNLKTFWQQGYPAARKDMRGRYPRHPWPENPLDHVATALTKKRLLQN
jgi:ATP-dependent helicase HrpB